MQYVSIFRCMYFGLKLALKDHFLVLSWETNINQV